MTLRDEFERCWPWLDASQASFGRTHNQKDIWAAIAEGRAQMWPAERAVILTEAIRHPIGLKSCNVWLQGGELDALKPMHPQLEQWAISQDYDRLIAWGRNGWLRALDGWENCGTRRAKWLRDVPEHVRPTKT